MIAQKAFDLSEAGQMVTQIHTLGEGNSFAYGAVGAITHSHSDGDYVVTTDGLKHHL